MVFEAGSGQVVGQHQQEVKQLFPHERFSYFTFQLLFEIHRITDGPWSLHVLELVPSQLGGTRPFGTP